MNELPREPALDLQLDVHRRHNPLNDEWVLVSPHRTARPWQGQMETTDSAPSAKHDPACFLCPGNTRAAGGALNPDYESTFVFENDFAALRPVQGWPIKGWPIHGRPTQGRGAKGSPLLRAEPESGICRVVCYSPLHNESWSHLSLQAVQSIIQTWIDQFTDLGSKPWINAVTIFENRGAMMGASSPHPHGQVWANATVPPEVSEESVNQERYLRETGRCLLCAYAALERTLGERVVCANERFVAVVPFWAIWPFEALVMPLHHHADVASLDEDDRKCFADILKSLNTRYDALFNVNFPYTMGLHQRPTDGGAHPAWHFHAHYYPPLLRSATVRKFMVGYELLAGPQRDISPERAAAQLRGAGVSGCT